MIKVKRTIIIIYYYLMFRFKGTIIIIFYYRIIIKKNNYNSQSTYSELHLSLREVPIQQQFLVYLKSK